MTHYTKQNIQHMALGALVDAKKASEEVASMEWHFAARQISVFHTCDIKPPAELSTAWKESWKIMRNEFNAHGSRPCEKHRATMFGKTWHALVIPYTEDSKYGQQFNTDPLSMLAFGFMITSARVIWFSRKTNRDRYLNYMNEQRLLEVMLSWSTRYVGKEDLPMVLRNIREMSPKQRRSDYKNLINHMRATGVWS